MNRRFSRDTVTEVADFVFWIRNPKWWRDEHDPYEGGSKKPVMHNTPVEVEDGLDKSKVTYVKKWVLRNGAQGWAHE